MCCNIKVMLQRLIFLLAILFSFALNAADFAVTAISGGSYVETDASGNITLYGGMAGTCSSPSSTSTCDTCTSTTTPPIACNQTNIHGALQIAITIRTTAAITTSRAVKIFTSDSAFAGRVEIGTASSIGPVGASETVLLSTSVTWGDVCDEDANVNNTSCTVTSPGPSNGTSFEDNRVILVWIDSDGDTTVEESETVSFPIVYHNVDNTSAAINSQAVCSAADNTKFGACGFELDVGGDEKLFVRDLIPSAATPLVPADAPPWFGVAFFYKDQTGAQNPASVSNSDNAPIIKAYDVNDGYSIDATLTGFTNYRDYCLVMGNINKAKNIFYYGTGGSVATNCGTPSEVVGLLDDKSCFISTAAFGSDMAEEVETFRQFRNEFLIPTEFGRSFIHAYYDLSPPLANFISQSEVLRFAARMALYPAYFFSLLSLKFGILYSLLSAVLFFIFIRRLKFFIQFYKAMSLRHRNRLGVFVLIFSVLLVLSNKSSAQVLPDTRKVQHQGAADGLVKIDKDGVYIYKPEVQNVRQSSHLRIGIVSNPDVESEICDENGGNCQTINFDDIYSGASGTGLEYIYEYYLFRDTGVNFGKLGLQAGLALSYAQGQGRLVADLNQESVESFSFLTMPLYAGLIYRFEYRDRQILVPYFGGGGVYALLAEKREDKSEVNSIGAPGFYGFGGALLNLSALDRDLGADFDAEYDVKNLWLSAEFKFLSVNSEAFSLENGYVQAGLGFDF